jgi:hypothetical protein
VLASPHSSERERERERERELKRLRAVNESANKNTTHAYLIQPMHATVDKTQVHKKKNKQKQLELGERYQKFKASSSRSSTTSQHTHVRPPSTQCTHTHTHICVYVYVCTCTNVLCGMLRAWHEEGHADQHSRRHGSAVPAVPTHRESRRHDRRSDPAPIRALGR